MYNKKFLLKVLGLLLIDIIILSLLFTGTFLTQSSENLALPLDKTIKLSGPIFDLMTTDNSIYLLTKSEDNENKNNLIKYDSNLNKVWNYTFDFPNNEEIVAVTDENLLMRIPEFSFGFSIKFHYFIFNKDGFQMNFTQEQHPGIDWYGSFIFGFGSSYLFIFKSYINQTFQINGVLLNPNNTTSTLFKYDFGYIYGDIQVQSPFYLDPNTLEIPILKRGWDETEYNYYLSDSYFLEYKIDKKVIELKSSNSVTILDEIDKHKILQNGIYAKESSVFHHNLNYLGLDAFITNQNTQFNIWTENGNISNFITQEFFSRPFNSYTSIYLGSEFQIKNKYYFNIFLRKGFEGTLFVDSYMPILLIYSQYSFHSTLDYYNYSNLLLESEIIEDISTTHVGNKLVYYGQIRTGSSEIYFFIKISKNKTSILDFIFQLPLILKLLIGFTFIAPVVLYFHKRSKSVMTTSETYPSMNEN